MCALLLAVPAAAQSKQDAAAVCAIARAPNESPTDWVKRASSVPMFKGPELEAVPLNDRPAFLRKRAGGPCPLADAWEWSLVLGQPLEPSGKGVVLRVEELVGGPLMSRFELVKNNVPPKPGRMVTAPCTHPLRPPTGDWVCFDVELEAAPGGPWRETMANKKLRLIDSWPAGHPEEAAGTRAMKAWCARLAAVPRRKGVTPAQVIAQAENGYVAEWPVDAMLRQMQEKPVEEKVKLMTGTAEQYGVIGCAP